MKKHWWVCFILSMILVSCQDTRLLAELEALHAHTELERQNMALVKAYIEHWNNQDLAAIRECLDPRCAIFIPGSTDIPMSVDSFTQYMEGIFKKYPEITYTIQELMAEGDKVTVRWTCIANYYKGSYAEGKEIFGSGIEIYAVRDGKIIVERCEMDTEEWNEQIEL